MQIWQLVVQFLQWCKRHRAENTVRHYESRLKPFVDRFGHREFIALTPMEVEAYLHDASHFSDGRPKSPDTQQANTIALERLQKWALAFKLIEQPVFSNLEKPSGRNREKIPSPEQFDAIDQASSPEFQRIFRALRLCGARPGELASAQIEDIQHSEDHPDVRLIVLRNHKTARKTNKPRRIAIGKQLGEIINQAIGDRTSGPIFLSPKGHPWTTQRLS